MAPKLIIMNSTYHDGFPFKLSLFNSRVLWVLDIPRRSITIRKNIAAVEEWTIKITMHQGLNIYETEGTLLDLVREPILQWSLGPEMTDALVKQLYPHAIDIRVAKCPCANDVALLGFILNSTYNGVFIGVTVSGFWEYNDTIWYDLTENIYSHLKDEHKGLTLIDMVLTNHFLVLLTSLGLFVSTDLRYPVSSGIKLTRADFCGFERVDYVKGKLWYNEKCFANRENFEADYVTITFDRNMTLSESSSCFYSKEPFLQWEPCLFSSFKTARFLPHVITFLIDQESQTGIYLFHTRSSKRTFVSVSVLKNEKPNSQPKFPNFHFPVSFSNPVGMVFHPRSHFLYVYGNQVWLSMDGGNTFEFVCDLLSNFVRKTAHCFHTSSIAFITHNGSIYMKKAGSPTYTYSGKCLEKVFTLYFDHLGFLHKLTPGGFHVGSAATGPKTVDVLGQHSRLDFNTALAPQYLSPKDMLFFAYVPKTASASSIEEMKFNNLHLGKMIEFGKNGLGIIRKVFEHTDSPLGFHTSIFTEMVEPFGIESEQESKCISGALYIELFKDDFYRITITTQDNAVVFTDSDREKTVVRPGYSSFLITEILDAKNALSLATMPLTVTTALDFPPHSWYLFDFGTVNGRNWTITLRRCNYWVQQNDRDISSPNVVKYIDVGNKLNYELKLVPNTRGLRLLRVPPVIIVVGNPTILQVKVEGHFDFVDSYHLKVEVASNYFQKGSTSISLIIWEASIQCFLVTMIPTMKSSCGYLRDMHYIPPRLIPEEAWESGVHKDRHGFNMIKTLPVNYRPPSNMGISIPLTDNFYHADPSKPIPRNLFHKSKETGKYKQCANATNREMCNCSEKDKLSDFLDVSDCKEKVRRFKFPVTQLPVVLEIRDEENRFLAGPPYLVTMTELNNRKNWQLKHNIPQNVKKMKDYLEPMLKTPVYNPLGLNLTIMGSELFHFKLSVVPGVTFCELVEEFQIYVDEVPLPFPGHTLIAVATSVVIGGFIFVAFIFQLRNIHPLRAFRRYVRENPAHQSNISVSA
nr:cation channel sperm-associated auxiliary subunit beta isoform X2 [Myodes glareolus]